MSWNHRVVKHKNPHPLDESEEYYYQIHEVHYNADGSIWSMTEDPIAPYGVNLKNLEETLRWMLRAVGEPILDSDMKYAEPDFDKGFSEIEEICKEFKLTHERYHNRGGTQVVTWWTKEEITIKIEHTGNMGASMMNVRSNLKNIFDDDDIVDMLRNTKGLKSEKEDGSPDYYYTHYLIFER